MKTKKMWQFLLFLILIPCLAGCSINGLTFRSGSGHLVEEKREISDFDRIELDGFGEIFMEQGDEVSLVIEAEDNLLPYLTTNMRGKTLEIGIRRNIRVAPTRVVRYYLTVKDLNELVLNGGGSLKAGELQTDRLKIDMNGGGSIEFEDLTTDVLEVKFSGAGSFEASGSATKQLIEFDGAGDYNAGDLKSREASVDINGLGNATLWVVNELDLDIDGAGLVSYYGEPKVRQRTAGVGNINSLGKHP